MAGANAVTSQSLVTAYAIPHVAEVAKTLERTLRVMNHPG
jgi:hypothetical protein